MIGVLLWWGLWCHDEVLVSSMGAWYTTAAWTLSLKVWLLCWMNFCVTFGHASMCNFLGIFCIFPSTWSIVGNNGSFRGMWTLWPLPKMQPLAFHHATHWWWHGWCCTCPQGPLLCKLGALGYKITWEDYHFEWPKCDMGNDVCYFNLAALPRVIPRIWHTLVVGIGLLQFHVARIVWKNKKHLSKSCNNMWQANFGNRYDKS